MASSDRVGRLVHNWVYGGALAGVLLLVLSPLLLSGLSAPLALAFLLLPAYMLHQYEEHDADRFRLFFNATVCRGQDVLSPLAVFVTNVPGVWGVLTASFYLASSRGLGWALIAVYLVLVNAIVHVVHAFIFGRYNPGLYTAIAVFFPLGFAALISIQRAGGGSLMSHVIGVSSGLIIHAVILIHVQLQMKR